jgi:YebC/PmpR family DNA-binding regulatory protein
MPNDNIKRAIDRATSDAGGDHYDEIYYEGFGPGGAAIMVKALTDNRNRTVGEVRAVFTRAGGNLGETGSVNYLFDQLGVITINADGADPDELALQAIDAGAEDIKTADGAVEVYTAPTALKAVQDALGAQGLQVEDAAITMQPKAMVSLSEEETIKVVRLMERLEDLDDVQEVYTNVEISDEVLAQV